MNTETQNAKTIAGEILTQLGGSKFITMTGSKNFGFDQKEEGVSLSFHIGRNAAKVKYCTITLTVMDTYKMEFFTHTNKYEAPKLVKEHSNVYCDQLQEIFTSVTGLYTHL